MPADERLNRRILHPRAVRGTSETNIDGLSSPVSQTLSCTDRFETRKKLIYKTKRRTCAELLVSPLQRRRIRVSLMGSEIKKNYLTRSLSSIPPCRWFHHLNILRQDIAAFYWFRLGHNRMSCSCLVFALFHANVLERLVSLYSSRVSG